MAALFEKLDNSLPVLRRKWTSVNTPTTDEALCFVVVSYNILADCHVSSQTYPYLPKGYRNMTERHPQILRELLYHHEADFICLQEVCTKQHGSSDCPFCTGIMYFVICFDIQIV